MSGPAPWPLPESWRPLITSYLEAAAGAGLTRATRATRRSHLGYMARSLRDKPGSVTEAQLLGWMGQHDHWSVETRRGYRNTAVGFFAWAHRTGHLSSDPAAQLPTVAVPPPSPRPTPDAAWEAALTVADPRTRLMLRLAAEAGLRRSEVAQIHVDDLTVGTYGATLLVHGKGRRERLIPINDDLAALIAAGAVGHSPELAAIGTGGWLFPGDEDGHLSPRWVGKLCAKAMPDGWTMHTLRHRFATRAYRGSRNLRAVQTLLGHSTVATTQRYTAVDDDEVRAAMMAAR